MLTNEMPYAAPARKTRTRSRSRARTRTQGVSAVYVIAFVVLFSLLALLLYRETEVTILTKEIAELEEQREEIIAKRDALLRELSPYMAQDHIEKIAKGALEMDYPTAGQTVRVAVEGGLEASHPESIAAEPQENVIARIFALLFDGRDKV